MPRPSKLTDAQADEIRRRIRAGEQALALAREFGVSTSTISGILKGRYHTPRAPRGRFQVPFGRQTDEPHD